MRIKTSEVARHVGERVHLQGWLHSVRRLGGVQFVILRDAWGTAQITAQAAQGAAIAAAGAGSESVIDVTASVRAEPRAPAGVELFDPELTVLSPVSGALPVVINKRRPAAGLPVLLDHAAVSWRHPRQQAIARLLAGVVSGFREALEGEGFCEIHTPKLVAAATEGGANVFPVRYFDRQAYLAQSPQFYKQIMVGVLERVFEVGPVFRAEPHTTARHLNEYVSLDAELGFIESHETVMHLLRDVIAGVVDTLALRCVAALECLEITLPVVPPEIPAVTFREARISVLGESTAEAAMKLDLSPEEERRLSSWALAERGSEFLFVTGFPLAKRPFYTHPAADGVTSNSFDLLFRGLELVTGGQRLHRYEDYLAALGRAGLPIEPFESYLTAFRCGMPPHGGFGMGLERFVMQLVGAKNIRETTLFPRDMHRLTP